jgi:hypothetical protein
MNIKKGFPIIRKAFFYKSNRIQQTLPEIRKGLKNHQISVSVNFNFLKINTKQHFSLTCLKWFELLQNLANPLV